MGFSLAQHRLTLPAGDSSWPPRNLPRLFQHMLFTRVFRFEPVACLRMESKRPDREKTKSKSTKSTVTGSNDPPTRNILFFVGESSELLGLAVTLLADKRQLKEGILLYSSPRKTGVGGSGLAEMSIDLRVVSWSTITCRRR